jgi:antitoxin MazE
MRTKIQKWGNSLALRIPKSFAEEAEVEVGSRVDLSVTDGQLIIRPVRSPRFELHALLVGVKEENLHAEISTGEPTGREAW